MALLRGRRRPDNERLLRPTRPSLGIEAAYRRCLSDLIEDMRASVERAVLAVYRAHPPEFAQDEPPKPLTEPQLARIRSLAEGGDARLPGPKAPVEELLNRGFIQAIPPTRARAEGYDPRFVAYELTASGDRIARTLMTPAARLKATMKNLSARWSDRFESTAPRLAKYFATDISKRSAANLKSILRDGGVSVRFQMTPVMRDVFDATVAENVGLIRTIPQQYLGEVEGLVMRSVQTGRDLGTLAKDLQKRYGITQRRAALIARDQNNKASSAMMHARQADLGIRKAVWMHSHAGKKPRPTHVKMDGKTYDITKGMWDSAEKRFVFPGELIDCRCTQRPILPGLA